MKDRVVAAKCTIEGQSNNASVDTIFANTRQFIYPAYPLNEQYARQVDHSGRALAKSLANAVALNTDLSGFVAKSLRRTISAMRAVGNSTPAHAVFCGISRSK
jgi:hypothetical protein